MTYMETPDTSANNTYSGIKRAKAQFDLFKDTPRTVLAEKLPLGQPGQCADKNLANVDDLFNEAKAATRARREKLGRPTSKRKDLLVVEPHITVEEENLDPDVLQSPTKTSIKLKRKSRLISNRRDSQDDESTTNVNLFVSFFQEKNVLEPFWPYLGVANHLADCKQYLPFCLPPTHRGF